MRGWQPAIDNKKQQLEKKNLRGRRKKGRSVASEDSCLLQGQFNKFYSTCSFVIAIHYLAFTLEKVTITKIV